MISETTRPSSVERHARIGPKRLKRATDYLEKWWGEIVNVGYVWEMPSDSKPGDHYKTRIEPVYNCDCPGFTGRNYCKHVDAASIMQLELFERRRREAFERAVSRMIRPREDWRYEDVTEFEALHPPVFVEGDRFLVRRDESAREPGQEHSPGDTNRRGWIVGVRRDEKDPFDYDGLLDGDVRPKPFAAVELMHCSELAEARDPIDGFPDEEIPA